MSTAKAIARLLLWSGKSVLLAGAPGTGKTRLGFELAREFTGLDPVVIVGRGDMAANELLYSYEPLDAQFRIVLGGLTVSVVTSWARLLLGLTPRWLLIDEVNRMNAETVLGSLFTALDMAHRQRVKVVPRWLIKQIIKEDVLMKEVADEAFLEEGKAKAVLEDLLGKISPSTHGAGSAGLPLPYSWRAVATMNIVDRSHLFRIGFAFLRRFPIVVVPGINRELNPKLEDELVHEAEKTASSIKGGYERLYKAMYNEICNNALDEWRLSSNITPLDKPVYTINLDDSLISRVLKTFDRSLRLVLSIATMMNSLGVEIGPAILADVCRLFTAAWLHGNIEESIVADASIASILLPQLGAIAPAIKSELLFKGETKRIENTMNLLNRIRKILGRNSMSAIYAEALRLELPVQ